MKTAEEVEDLFGWFVVLAAYITRAWLWKYDYANTLIIGSGLPVIPAKAEALTPSGSCRSPDVVIRTRKLETS